MKKALIFIFTTIPFLGFAQVGGRYSNQSYNIVPSARIVALGGNLIAVKDKDLNIAFQNPALLNPSMTKQFTSSGVNYFADVNGGIFGMAKDFGKKGTFATSLTYLNYGKFTEADESSTITGNFSANDYTFSTLWGKQLDSLFSVGAALKTMYSQLNQYKSLSMAVDLGGTYYNEKNMFIVSLLAKNIGTQLKPYIANEREQLATEVQLALSKQLKHVPFRISLAAENLQKFKLAPQDSLISTTQKQKKNSTLFLDNLTRHFVIGGELLITKNFNLRFGYNYRRRQEFIVSSHKAMVGFSFGFGFKIAKFQISYGRAAYSLAGASNVFSFSRTFGNFPKTK